MNTKIFLALTLSVAAATCLPARVSLARDSHDNQVSAARNSRDNQEQQFRAQQQEARSGQEASLRAQEEAARRGQQQNRQVQEEAARAQQAAQARQEQQMRARQQSAPRQEQMQMRAQEQAAPRQEEMRAQNQLAPRQEEMRAQNQLAPRQEEMRAQNQLAPRQEEMRGQQQSAQRQQEQLREPQAASGGYGQERNLPARSLAEQRPAAGGRDFGLTANVAPAPAPNYIQRAISPRPLGTTAVPLEKAVSMPMFNDQQLSPNERTHANQIRQSLQQHLTAVPLAQAPANYQSVPQQALDYYTNNFQAVINNQPLCITRINTFVDPFPVNDYPYWYQPEPGWIFSNGFTLGNLVRVGLDWLGFGWHPYYGPAPGGFICATNYLPTPWFYYPSYGLWRVAGVNGWAPAGPPYDYTGPISVETIEPRQVSVADPFTGWRHERYINVTYMYNAYFYPQYDRWGYVNRHGYFVWLNV